MAPTCYRSTAAARATWAKEGLRSPTAPLSCGHGTAAVPGEQPSAVAHDPHGRLIFGEPSLLRLPSGKLLCMMRTGDYLYQAFSTDDGWVWQGLRRSPIWGFPSHLLRLRSGRILCTYGYRREPFGIRACLSDDEGETWDVSNEIVIRDDGVHRDLGYPSSVQLQDGRILSVYYFHGEDDVRYIAGSIYTEDHV